MDFKRFDHYDHARLSEDIGIILNADDNDLRIKATIEACIREFVGSGMSDDQLENLHLYLHADDVQACSDHVNRSLERDLYGWCITCCRDRLGYPKDFYLDDRIYVRINIPYDYGMEGRQFTDAHRLTHYNRNRPRATWSHGPHVDTWYGHSFTATNFWFSVCGTNPSSSMMLYPQYHQRDVPFDPQSMYATYDVAMRNATELSLRPGENFVFDPELLHSTRLNTSEETRIVITIRVSSELPRFSDVTTHGIYDDWLRASDIEEGNLKAKKVGEKVSPPDYPEIFVEPVLSAKIGSEFKLHESSQLGREALAGIPSGVPFKLMQDDQVFTAVIDSDHLYVLNERCPHIGAPLERGSYSNGKIRCPAHGVTFSLESGISECSKLSINTHKIRLI